MTARALATVMVWRSDCWRRLEFTRAGITPIIDRPEVERLFSTYIVMALNWWWLDIDADIIVRSERDV